MVKFKFHELHVCNNALLFIDDDFATNEEFQKTERFGLSSQYTKTATSLGWSIAGGSSDTSKQCNGYLPKGIDSVNVCVVYSTIVKRRH